MSNESCKRYAIGEVQIDGITSGDSEPSYEALANGVKSTGATIADALENLARIIRLGDGAMNNPIKAVNESPEMQNTLKKQGKVQVRGEIELPPDLPLDSRAPVLKTSEEVFEMFCESARSAFMQTFVAGDETKAIAKGVSFDAQAAMLPVLIAFVVASMRRKLEERALGAQITPLYIVGLEILEQLHMCDKEAVLSYARSELDDMSVALPIVQVQAPPELQ